MISVTVKLFGTLPRSFKDYDHESGMTVALEDDSRVADLIRVLDIEGKDVTVAIDGRIVQKSEPLSDGSGVRILQAVHGG